MAPQFDELGYGREIRNTLADIVLRENVSKSLRVFSAFSDDSKRLAVHDVRTVKIFDIESSQTNQSLSVILDYFE